ncbi:MAG: hypothetical protein RLN88_12365, partial [Ekhidna sp.]
ASAILDAFNLAGAATGLEGQGSSLSSALSSGSSALFANSQSEQPRAYLQYLFFDENYNFVEAGSSFREVTEISLGKFAKYESGKLTYSQAGYLFVYLVNETNVDQDVFFDDLKIIHSSATSGFKVSQVNDFYPFGLPMSNSWRAPGYVDPGLMYQSYFNSYDSLIGNYDFLLRNYDPVLGRWLQTDPYGQFASPYIGMGNLPHLGVDPDGGLFDAIFGKIIYDVFASGLVGGIIGAFADDEGSNRDGFIKGFFAGMGTYALAQTWTGGNLPGVLSSVGDGIGGVINNITHFASTGVGRNIAINTIGENVVYKTINKPDLEIIDPLDFSSLYTRPKLEYIERLGYSKQQLEAGADYALEFVNQNYAEKSMACNYGLASSFEYVTGSRDLWGKQANDILSFAESNPDLWAPATLEEAATATNMGYYSFGGTQYADHGHVVQVLPSDVKEDVWRSVRVLDTGLEKWWKNTINYSWVGTEKNKIKYFIYLKR